MAKVTDADLAGDPEVFATNPLMLVVPADNPMGIALPGGGGVPGLAQILDHDVTMAVCAPEVPCGAAAAAQAFVDLILSDDGQQILRDAGFLEP